MLFIIGLLIPRLTMHICNKCFIYCGFLMSGYKHRIYNGKPANPCMCCNTIPFAVMKLPKIWWWSHVRVHFVLKVQFGVGGGL